MKICTGFSPIFSKQAKYVITKMATSTNNHKPPANDLKLPTNNQKLPANKHKPHLHMKLKH